MCFVVVVGLFGRETARLIVVLSAGPLGFLWGNKASMPERI